MTISVKDQLKFLLISKTLPLNLNGDVPFEVIFMKPNVHMNETLIDSHQKIWTHIPESYYYKNTEGLRVPIFYIK